MGLRLTYKNDESEPPRLVDDIPPEPMSAEETILSIAELYLALLRDMEEARRENGALSDYAEGVMSAYVQTLQLFQSWEKMGEYGLDFEIERKFPVK